VYVGFLAALQALEVVYRKRPAVGLDGGSVPIASVLKDKLDIDSVLMGFNLPDDSVHGSNEELNPSSYFRGICSYTLLSWTSLAVKPGKSRSSRAEGRQIT